MRAAASFSDVGEAGVALSVLEGSGISAQLENVESSVNLSGGLPDIRLMVEEVDYDRACELVQPLFSRTEATPKPEVVGGKQASLMTFVHRAAKFVADL